MRRRLRSRTNRSCATHGPSNFQNRQTARIFKADSVKSIPRIQGQKTSDWASCKRQLALRVRGERRLRSIVRSQRSQKLAQIFIQLNDGETRTVRKRNVQRSLHRMGFGSRRPTRVLLLNARHRAVRLAWAREHRNCRVEDSKRVAWSEESRFRLLNADGRLRIWSQAHEALDIACPVG
ncbi:HTH_Tnp_Tc3_2 domain-containing protein [Trichonephila clavipes]|nr:HTH_Tnp_Tc3_2 domain-containing protein [Trichonephila clavipes]